VQYIAPMANTKINGRIIALVDMNAFLASVEECMNPLLKGRPVIVGGLPNERGIVICANYAARSFGVKFGMMFHEARKLTPGAIFIRGDSHIYQDYWDRICRIFYDFMPLLEPVSIDEAYLDFTGCIRDYSELASYAESLKVWIKSSTGLSCSVGIGSSKTIAKIASGMEKPDGLVIVPPGDEADFLSPLPIKMLPGVGHKTANTLGDFGVETIGDILKIPRKLLENKFGLRGGEFYDCAQGLDPRSVKESGNPKSVSRESSFHNDVIDKEEIYAHLYYLLERASAKLRRLKLKALSGKIKLRFSDFGFDELPFQFQKSSNIESELFEDFKGHYHKLHTRRVALRQIGIILSHLVPDLSQINLFGGLSERMSGVSRSMDDIRERFGYHSVVVGKTLPLSNTYEKRQYGYELRTSSLTK